MSKAFVACLVVAATQLSGCMASQKLKAEDRQAIRTVYIDRSVVLTEKPMIMTRAMGIGAGIGGAIGAAVAASGSGSTEEQFVHYLTSNGIDIRKQVAIAFADALASGKILSVVDSADAADATIKLEIPVYGIGYTANMFSHDYRVVLSVKATMIRSGRDVWVKQVVENSMHGGEPAPYDDIVSKPEVTLAQIDLSARAAARELADDIHSSK